MQTRKLGKDGLTVPAMGLGCMGMSISYGERDDDSSIATIHRAIERGAGFLDTSDMYGQGKNEELVGRAIVGKRDKVILATKFGNLRLPDGKSGVNGRPEYALEACEKNLKRLGVDVIDLYYLHRVDPDVPIEETVGGMAKLVEQGKVRYIGLSEAGEQTVRRGHSVYPITALQSEYSLWTRDLEADILPACRELGIGFVPYAPLGRGFLTGTIRTPGDLIETDRRHDHPRFHAENIERNLKLLPALEQVAAARNCSLTQVALAWVLAQGDDIVPIPGTKKPSRLDENLAALDVRLTDDDLATLNRVFAPGVTAGTRYPPGGMKRVGI